MSDFSTFFPQASGGTDWVATIQTSNFPAEAGKGYFVNTTSAEITVTLPVGVVGTEIVIQDYAGMFGTNKVIFAANGSEKIQGVTDDYQCTVNNATVTLIYQDATKGWNADNIKTTVIPALTVDFLVVAGGGGGGSEYAAGGGAGGLRTSFGTVSPITISGTGSMESSLSLLTATNYPLTIGTGGLGTVGAVSSGPGNNGTDSIFSNKTSTGGGGGGNNDGGDGGSGGGAGCSAGTGNIGTAVTSPVVQGFDGGNRGSYSPKYPTGGGGGAKEVGYSAPDQNSAGNGGDGLEINILGGTGNFYAGGGGGGGQSTLSATSGGSSIGGSGAGIGANLSIGGNGTVNTGSGGGGAGSDSGRAGGNGSDGIIILRYPKYYIISGISGTTITVGTDSVTTFTGAGTTGNIQFN